MNPNPSVSRYLDAYTKFMRGAQGPAWMAPMREQALEIVSEHGLPTTKEEDWKYTNVSALAKIVLNLPARKPGVISVTRLAERTYVGEGARIVFVNGLYAPELSSLEAGGIIVSSLAAAQRTHGELIEKHLGKYAASGANMFTALNTAFLRDGALVVIPKGVHVEHPIQLLFVMQSSDGGTFASPRTLIIAEAGSKATLVETHIALTPDSYFSNSVTEIVCEENAELTHYNIQEESVNAFHIAATTVKQSAGSTYRSCSVMTGGRLTRNTIDIALGGEHCTCELDGLYIAGGNQHVDNHTTIDHLKPHGSSRQLYKGILKNHARAVFNGRVYVRQDAQKTDAQQKNNNLMLSDDARVDTKPQLEIFADDVKCTHGATVGQLDDDALFYLKTRGIGALRGKEILTYGFAHEVLERITLEPLRARLENLLMEQVGDKSL